MLNCPYCERKSRSNSGLSMHWRGYHPETWKGNVEDSYPPDFDKGTPEPLRTSKRGKAQLTEEQRVIRRKQQKNWYDRHKRKKSVKSALTVDTTSDAAKAILLAAQVIQAVSAQFRITNETGRNT